ncbi:MULTISPECIES: adenylate/guanylate cyclase domain-containing protein [unclassified Roseofilum]|uniref:adenylate/guanylate cyclase domain-containing protein n=1 Tax=unclassified Roseofilum TaxID=2620099 RepID=UPI001B26AB1B|nr:MULTISPECIES: adenylate/guanylate cyclase domain-containing protein [unclassified Roseofilum]MBP0008701.1 DUF3365 domain-containing protein [Roseofilum sp. Belize Diploria]MBP0033110.1 DUF3365 domain-containing protein [Roseofilum sp. Belize BBD 4]
MDNFLHKLIQESNSFFYKHTIVCLILLFCLSIGIGLANTYEMSSNLIEDQAISTAISYSNLIQEARNLYSSEVVDRAQDVDGISVSHDYLNITGAIPLPATFLMKLGWKIGEQNTGMMVKLYSDYPFRGGQAMIKQTISDRFEQDALSALRKRPNEPYYRFEKMAGYSSLRYAQADIMEPTCVACHNTHPDSPKTDWKIGDVRGILEIILPLDEFIEETHEHLKETLMMLLFHSILALSAIAVVINRLRQTSKELERRVVERTAQLQEANKELESEQQKSDRLLLNILPKPIADQLKQGHNPIAEWFPEVTILFADIVGFTKLASSISAPTLVNYLNEIFSSFDYWADEYQLEKIKTIGDNYMVVGGVPTNRPNVAIAVAEMALKIQEEVFKFNLKHQTLLTIRIGINTGPVVAGVIGKKKFIYDLWGDAVNIASRMESHCLPGKIQVTKETYNALRDDYQLEKRGEIEVKGKGKMTTYFLEGRITP